MKVFKVQLWYHGTAVFEVEARDDEEAEARAIELLDDSQDGVSLEVNDAVVTLADCQYTDQQELEDREREDR